MIQSNELRIGNWYNFKNPLNGTLTPTRFSTWVDALDFEAYAEPIPLSAEILEKAGFEWNGGHWLGKLVNNWRMKIFHDDDHDFMWAISNWNVIVLHSVHQLQNLYFALTGEELPVKL